jgi:hypothetical protein
VHYSAGFTLLLVVLVGSVRSASAQAGEKGETPEPNLEEPVSSPAPETEAPNIDTLSQRAIEHYEIQYGKPRMEVRVKGARTGLAVSAGVGVLSIALSGGWIACVNRKPSSPTDLFPPECNALLGAGFVLGLASAVGMITSGAILGVRKRKLRELQQAQGTTPRRVQWDLGRSRLVF